MDTDPAYPRLHHLFGAYFHQDWDMEGHDWPDLVRNYARGSPAAELLATADEADALAAAGDSDEVLERRLDREFGCRYDAHPEADGPGVRPWLGQIAGLLRELARQSGGAGLRPPHDAGVAAALARLRALAGALPRPGCEWEECPRFDPPSSSAEVAAYERAAGFPLPAALRAFLVDVGAVVGMSVHNGYWVGGVERLTAAVIRGDYPREVAGEPAAPVATDGGGNAFLLSAGGRVWRWDRETGSTSPAAGSFGAFLDRMVADWSAYVEDTPGWRFLV